jgi:hypothetical protein
LPAHFGEKKVGVAENAGQRRIFSDAPTMLRNY